MERRVLSDEEKNSLEPELIQFVYKQILEYRIGPEILEQALLQAVLFARVSKRRMDVKVFERLLEKITEYEGLSLFDDRDDGEVGSYRRC